MSRQCINVTGYKVLKVISAILVITILLCSIFLVMKIIPFTEHLTDISTESLIKISVISCASLFVIFLVKGNLKWRKKTR